MVKKICLQCGKEFMVSNKRKLTAKYCCKTCHNKSMENKEFLRCTYCGNKITRKLSKIREHNFCDLNCLGKWNGERNTIPIEKTCFICGKSFIVPPNRRKTATTCSIECQNKWQSINRTGEHAANWQGGAVKVKCKECGNDFYTQKYKTKLKSNIFCSLTCKINYWTKNVITSERFKQKRIIGNLKMLSSKENKPYKETSIERSIRLFFRR